MAGKVHMMMKPAMVRQGDVLIIPIDRKPRPMDIGDKLMEGKRLVLAHGEVTGHAHAIYPEQDVIEGITDRIDCAALYELEYPHFYAPLDPAIQQEGAYLRVESRCLLRHEEHETISLAPGDYVVLRQKEYDPREDRMSRFVAD